MREFSKFSPRFWIDANTKKLIKHSTEAILVAVYLQTSHHSHSTGVFFLPLDYIVRDTGLPLKKVEQVIAYLCEIKYCHYDYHHEYIWIVGYGLEQTGGPLKIADKRTAQIQRYYDQLPPLCFLATFYAIHGQDFHLTALAKEHHVESLSTSYPNDAPSKGDLDDGSSLSYPIEAPSKEHLDQASSEKCPLEAPSMVLRSKEKEKEKKKDNEKEKENNIVAQVRRCDGEDPVNEIFAHWKITMHHPQAQLDPKRRKIIRQVLQTGYSVDELCQAISGCAVTPHNMGDNDKGQRYVGLHVIFKNGDQIDRFIANFHNPPKKKPETLLEKNQAAMDLWLRQKEQEQEDLECY